jgi:hypothetical protein
LSDAAAIFGAGQSKGFANDPEQGRVRLDIGVDGLSVDDEPCHDRILPAFVNAGITALVFYLTQVVLR